MAANPQGIRPKKFTPAVSVIMPVLNEVGHLEAAVSSILKQNYSGELELLLLLGPSTDGTNDLAIKIASADSRIRLIDNPRGLTTVGVNLGVKAAKHNVIVRIDAHSEPTEGYIQRGVEILFEQGAAEVGGIMDARGRSAFQKAVAFAYKSRFGIGGGAYHLGGEAGEAESAYLGIFQRQSFEAVGGYDESIVRGEDWDLAQRLKAAGGKVWFTPELRVIYWPRGRVSKLVRQFYSTGVWRGDLTRRDPARASKRYFVPPAAVLAIMLGFLFLAFRLTIGVIPATAYLLMVIAVACSAKGLSLKSRAALVVALVAMHMGWGWGFLVGYSRGARGTIDRSRVGAGSK
ncbi:MAG: glycosyltransferase family 2 protein [Micrococcales bacterium]